MEVWDIPLKSDEVFGYEDVQAELMNDSVVELG
jgi:hypothetical protein